MILPSLAASLMLLQDGGAVTVTLDIPYAGTEDPRQRLDLYLPRECPSGRLPVIVYLHGEGRKGSRAEGAGQLMPLVRTGKYAGVSVDKFVVAP